MELTSSVVPASVWKTGRETIEIENPANLRIVTTGDLGVTILNAGPPHGKKWVVALRLEIVEAEK